MRVMIPPTGLLRAAALIVLAHSCHAFADDWEQWRGNDRLAIWREDGIMERFPEQGLKPSWNVEIGSGYSGPVVSDGKIITMDYFPKPDTETAEAIERTICLDEQTGELLWADQWETHYREILGSYRTGPRATPTIDGNRVYTLGSVGHIRCNDLDSGELIWSHDSREEYQLLIPVFGTSIAPIVDGDLVIYAPGGKDTEQLRAYNKATGEEVWKACHATYELGYSQFAIFEHAGARQLIYWDPEWLRGLNPQTGQIHWQVPMTCKSAMCIATPVKSESKILVSSFYDGSMLVELDDARPSAKMLWHVTGRGEKPDQTFGLHSVITTPIIEGDYFYGTGSYGEFRGLRLKDSERIWENKEITRQGRWGSAFLDAHDDKYFMTNDLGELLIVRFSPAGPQVIDRTQLIDPDTESGYGPRKFANSIINWCHPAFANKHVIIRNDQRIVRVSLAKP